VITDRWGATHAEVAASRPCDALVAAGAVRADRAISIDAPVDLVFRWLCQLRVAPYSYDWLDNLGRRSPPTLTPGLEDLEVGQRFMRIFTLSSFLPDRHVTLLTGGRTAVTYAVQAEPGGTRLAVRIDFMMHPWLAAPLVAGDLVMMRRQLHTLKRLAERDASIRSPSTT
jgi:hypothetical protein